jgi:pyruvate kinase
MIDAGVNVFRINFSHADYEDVKERIDIIRGLNEEFGYTTAILADLQGPKLRVGVMKEDVVVKGDIITFQTAEDVPGTAQKSLHELQRISKRCKSGRKNTFRRWKIDV